MKFKTHGPQIPKGTVRVSGAKNAATRMMAAALLTDEKVVLSNFPTELVDVQYKGRFMERIGAEVIYLPQSQELAVTASNLSTETLSDYNYPIRTTYLLAAGQLHRNGIAKIPYPGGCKLGERKYDLHILVWEYLGCTVTEKEDHIEIKVRNGSLVGNEISFPITTVGGTENALLCGSIAKGTTIVNNAYITPEISNLIELLRLMGARIKIEGSARLIIEGVSRLHGATCRVMPDRIEALTWLVFGAITNGSITIEDVPFDQMRIPLLHLQEAGVNYFHNETSIHINPSCISKHLIQPFELACGTHPGVISDMQPFFVLLALSAQGRSVIYDYRYPMRTAYLEELNKISHHGISSDKTDMVSRITIKGPIQYENAFMESTDLRGSMAMIIAAICGRGESSVSRAEMALRGYNMLSKKLESLNLKFTLTDD